MGFKKTMKKVGKGITKGVGYTVGGVAVVLCAAAEAESRREVAALEEQLLLAQIRRRRLGYRF